MNQNIQNIISSENFEELENYLLDLNNTFILSDLEDFYAIIDDDIVRSPQQKPLLVIVAKHCSKKATEILIHKGVNINKLYLHYSVKVNASYFLFRDFFYTFHSVINSFDYISKKVIKAIKHLLEIAQEKKIQIDLSSQHTFCAPDEIRQLSASHIGINIYNYSPLQLIAGIRIKKKDVVYNKELVEDIISTTRLLLLSGQNVYHRKNDPQNVFVHIAKIYYQCIERKFGFKMYKESILISVDSATVFGMVTEPAIMDMLINHSSQKALNECKKDLFINVSGKTSIKDEAIFFAFKHSFFSLDFKIKAAQEFLSSTFSEYKKQYIKIPREIASSLAQYLTCEDAESLSKVNKSISDTTKNSLIQSDLSLNETISKKFRKLALKRSIDVYMI